MYSLLIVNDQKRDLEGLKNVFTGLEEIRLIDAVGDADQATCCIDNTRIDVVVLDLFIPDALKVLDHICQLDEMLRPKVFAISYVSDERIIMAVRDKIQFCFVRPIANEAIMLRTLELLHAMDRIRTTPPTALELIENRIFKCIRDLGVPANLKGYYYLRDAVRIHVLSNRPSDLSATNDIYPVVARLNDTGPALVEHAMRNAIEITWTRGNLKMIHQYFGYTVNDHKGKPGNMEFISMIAEHVRSSLRVRRFDGNAAE